MPPPPSHVTRVFPQWIPRSCSVFTMVSGCTRVCGGVTHACAAFHALLFTCMWLYVCLWGSCGALHACVVVCVQFHTRVRLDMYGCTHVCGCSCFVVHMYVVVCVFWGSCGALNACVVVCVRFHTRVRLYMCGCTRMQLYMCGCTRVCGCSCPVVHMYVVVCVSMGLLWGSTCVCGCVCAVLHACAAVHVSLHTRVRLFMLCCTHVCG